MFRRWLIWVSAYKSYKTCAASEDSDQSAHPRRLIRVVADRLCLLQPPGYPKWDKREPMSYRVDVQADLCWSHRSSCRFVVYWLILAYQFCHRNKLLIVTANGLKKAYFIIKCFFYTWNYFLITKTNLFKYIGNLIQKKKMQIFGQKTLIF